MLVWQSALCIGADFAAVASSTVLPLLIPGLLCPCLQATTQGSDVERLRAAGIPVALDADQYHSELQLLLRHGLQQAVCCVARSYRACSCINVLVCWLSYAGSQVMASNLPHCNQ
jgi:hypothetical protein